VRALFALGVAGVRAIGMIESFAVRVLRVSGQMRANGWRKIVIASVWHVGTQELFIVNNPAAMSEQMSASAGPPPFSKSIARQRVRPLPIK
jgi:hypothetical protein